MLCFFCLNISGQTRVVVPEPKHHSHISFIENKTQWEERIRFKSEIRGGALFFEDNAITYTFLDPEYLDKISAIKSGSTSVELDSLVTCYAYRMWFDGANITPEIKGHYPKKEYNNYYIGNNPDKWSSNVQKYEKIEYKELYSGINLLFYEQHQAYKYEFIVKKGSNPSQIRLRYEGVDKLALEGNNLLIKVGKHETVERAPYAYQYNEKGEKIQRECHFVVDGKTVTFKIKEYDKNKELIIDPTLIFASFTGSTADNWGYSATYDGQGNLYGGGTVYGIGYPVTTGAFQTSYGGASASFCDIAITKFSSDGSQAIFATYLGGNGADAPHSLIVNDNNELYVLASTSSGNYPVIAGAYDISFNSGTSVSVTGQNYYNGGSDIAISRFNSTGTQLLSSTYFGGSGNDGLNRSLVYNYADEIRGEINLDGNGNVIVVSSTNSTNLPVTAGALQTTYGGGGQDGLIAKFSANLQNLIWCTYFGGNAADAIYNMCLDASNNIYICGGTQSTNLATTSNAISTSPIGGWDGFITKISANGNSILAATYYGKTGYDQTYLITLDKDENIVVLGQTDASNALAWVQNAAWYSGQGQFLSNLSNDLTTVNWSTSFGSSNNASPNISPTALMVDICDNIHISGWGGNSGGGRITTTGMPITHDALQSTTDGNDFYFMSIDAHASRLLYATFFGGTAGEHVDGGTSRFDKKGIVYQAVCAGCGGSSSFPVSSNVVSQTNNSVNCNLGVVKLDFNLGTIVADFSAPSNVIVVCINVPVTFDNNSKVLSDSAALYFWDFGDGTTDTAENPMHTFYYPGSYTVVLIVVDSTSCNIADTVIKNIIVSISSSNLLPEIDVCKGDYIQIGITPSSDPDVTYRWYPSVGLSDYTIANPIFNDTVSRFYMMLYDRIVCIDTFYLQVNVIPVPIGKTTDTLVCMGDTMVWDLGGILMDSYIWSSNPDFTDTLNISIDNPVLETVLQNSSVFYSQRIKDECTILDTLQIDVSSFVLEFDTFPKLCIGDTMQLKVNVKDPELGSTFWYEWSPRQHIIGYNRVPQPPISPDTSMFFYVTVNNERGCQGKDSIWIDVVNLQANAKINPISCYGFTDGSISISVQGGDDPYSYQWRHTSLDTAYINSLPEGTYYVTITDSNHCSIDTSFTFIEPAPLYLRLDNVVDTVFCNNICNGEALAVASGGTLPYSFDWITGDNTAQINDLCAGEYFLLLTDAHGCIDSTTLIVNDTSDMNVSYTSEPELCAGICGGSIQIIINQAQLPCSFNWKTGQTSDFLDSLCKGTYDVTVTDSRYCKRRLFPKVIGPDPVEIDKITIIHPYCHGMKDGSITVNVKGGTPPFEYYWDGKQGTNILSGLESSGDYHLKIIDANLCQYDTIVYLQDYDILSENHTVSSTLCKDICMGKISVTIEGGVQPYTYQWNNGESTPSLNNLCTGNYFLRVYDSNNCEITVNVTVTIDSNYILNLTNTWSDTTTLYKSQSTTIYGSDFGQGFSYSWSPENYLDTATGTKVISTPEQTITYTYIVSDTFGCVGVSAIEIIVKDVVCEDPYVFVPNAFSPNGDGLNDILYVRGDLLEKVEFAVYNRWGEKLFETKDKNIGWNGTFKGELCSPGVYVYYLDATCLGGLQYIHKGNVTLVR
jgi:gliding motility-associated-like protein